MAKTKGRRGGARKGAGRKPVEAPRRNRVVLLLTDEEHELLKARAAERPIGTCGRELLVRSLKRAR